MALNTFDGDVTVRGTLKATAASLPANCVGDANFTGSDPLGADKQEHQFSKVLAQVHGTAAVDERRVIHVARGDGAVVAVRAGVMVAAVGGATVTVDVKANGVSIMTGVITLDNANVAYTPEVGSVATDDYLANSVFDVTLDATVGGGTLPQGVFVEVVFREAAD